MKKLFRALSLCLALALCVSGSTGRGSRRHARPPGRTCHHRRKPP